jgi:hypothetical protein
MYRKLTVTLLLLVMAFQAMTFPLLSSSRDNLADMAHAVMHWQQEGHHHHDSGDYHVEDSDESTRHLMADHSGAPAVLPAASLGFFRQDTSIHTLLSTRTTPHPYLEGLLRPPRPAA